jgi:hypothetical protein
MDTPVAQEPVNQEKEKPCLSGNFVVFSIINERLFFAKSEVSFHIFNLVVNFFWNGSKQPDPACQHHCLPISKNG